MSQRVRLLSSGISVPSIGFGTYKLGDNHKTKDLIRYALETGYRQIDAA